MKNKFFKKFLDLFKEAHNQDFSQTELSFNEKVKRILDGEEDYSILYDYEKLASLNYEEEKRVVEKITSDYLKARQDI